MLSLCQRVETTQPTNKKGTFETRRSFQKGHKGVHTTTKFERKEISRPGSERDASHVLLSTSYISHTFVFRPSFAFTLTLDSLGSPFSNERDASPKFKGRNSVNKVRRAVPMSSCLSSENPRVQNRTQTGLFQRSGVPCRGNKLFCFEQVRLVL